MIHDSCDSRKTKAPGGEPWGFVLCCYRKFALWGNDGIIRLAQRQISLQAESETSLDRMAEAVLPPGKGSLPHYHPEVEEAYYLLWGEAEMEVDGQVETVEAGDVVVIPPGTVHHIRNLGDKEVILLVTCAPAWTSDCEDLNVLTRITSFLTIDKIERTIS